MMNDDLKQYKNWAIWIPAIMLILAIFSWPYGYYIFLRWIVTAGAAFLVWFTFSVNKKIWVVLFVVIALLFNPLVPVHLDKDTWIFLDIFAASIFAISSFVFKKIK